MLVRVSSIGMDDTRAYALQDQFVAEMLAGLDAPSRARLIGSSVAGQAGQGEGPATQQPLQREPRQQARQEARQPAHQEARQNAQQAVAQAERHQAQQAVEQTMEHKAR